MDISTHLIEPGHRDYWSARQLAFAEIKELERLIAIRDASPTYIGGAWNHDEDCVEPVENIGPYDDVAHHQDRIANNPNVVSILEAQNRLDLLTL